MGIQYGNLTLYGVSQEEVFKYLNEIGQDAYISPAFNLFTTVYARCVEEQSKSQRLKLANLDSSFTIILNQYKSGSIATLVFLATHLSRVFSCPAFAAFIYDGDCFWYHLSQEGVMLDEYTTCGGDNWQPGQGISELSSQIKGGDAKKLCTAFKQEKFVNQIETVLRKPQGFTKESCLLNLSRYDTLIQIKNYDSPVTRHEALARVLGICPGLVLGLDYTAIDTGELGDHWYDFQHGEIDVPSFEEIDVMIKKTSV